MKKLKLSADQVGSIAKQFVATHGREKWLNGVSFKDGVLEISDEISKEVEAIDPDKDVVAEEKEAKSKRLKALKKKVNRIDDLVELLFEQGVIK